jgi:hypothetical protein
LSKPKLEWSKAGEQEDFDAAHQYLSLVTSESQAKTLVRDLRRAAPVEHAAKDLLRVAQLRYCPATIRTSTTISKKSRRAKVSHPCCLFVEP